MVTSIEAKGNKKQVLEGDLMSDEHPRYANPTITEAICDIHFRLPASNAWKPSLPGEIFKHIQDEFPIMEPVLDIGLQLDIGSSGTSTKLLAQPQKFRFKHASRPLILQIAENTFSINVLAPYPGWEAMRSYTLDAWQQIRTILQPEIISRVGLRYINVMARETDQDRLHDWLVSTEYIPKGILDSEAGFLLRLQSHLDTKNTLIITIGDTIPNAESSYGTIIFDIDRIVEQAITLKQEILEKAIDILHNDIWNTFSTARGEKLDRFLRRKIHE